MIIRKIWFVIIPATGLTILAAPSAPSAALASTTQLPVTVQSVTFYNGKHFTFNPCNPIGASGTTFRNTAHRIYVDVEYSDWEGTHTDQYNWYSPDGKLYAQDTSSPYTSHGATAGCDYLDVSGTNASSHLGQWTLRLVVDGQVVRMGSFGLAHGAAGRISLQRISFYIGKQFHLGPCQPAGPPATRFPATTGRIYAFVQYSSWDGAHTDQYRWYTPNGRFYDQNPPLPYAGRGATNDCDYLSVAGTRAARLVGRWTFVLLIDGRPAGKATFDLTRG
jgi:hypothetical protein